MTYDLIAWIEDTYDEYDRIACLADTDGRVTTAAKYREAGAELYRLYLETKKLSGR